MYHDLVSNLYIPWIYVLIDGKSEKHYEEVFNSIINIITINHCIEININSIVI